MFTVKKYIVGLLIGTIAFSGIAIVDDVIVKFSMAAASSLAFTIVGSFYSAGLITSKAEGGKARLYLFVILLGIFLYIFTQIAKGIIWLFSFPMWVYIVVVIISVCLIVLIMMIKDKKAKSVYQESIIKHVVNDSQELKGQVVSVETSSVDSRGKSIRELLREEENLDYILAYHNNPHSPGLEYVKVYQSALKHRTIKGYIKMDRAAAFWGDVYYAEDKRWFRI